MNKILLDAADLLRDGKEGPRWIQHNYHGRDKYGRDTYCAIAAIRKIAGTSLSPYTNVNRPPEYKEAVHTLARLVVGPNITEKHAETFVIDWNDERGRTARQVIRAMYKAAGVPWYKRLFK